MMDISRQLNQIANKALLHDYINQLPDGADVVIAAMIPTEDGADPISVMTLGPVDKRTVLWITEHIRAHIVGTVEDPS